MKRILAVFLVILMLPLSGLAAPPTPEEFQAQNIVAWISWCSIESLYMKWQKPLDENLHLLWDIPFRLDLADTITAAKKNANVDLTVTQYTKPDGTKGIYHLAVKNSDAISLFGYGITHSYFGFLQDTQSVGLGANSSEGSTDLLYAYASLLIMPGKLDTKVEEVIDCVRTMYEGISGEYGSPTKYSFKQRDNEFLLFNDAGEVDYKTIEDVFEATNLHLGNTARLNIEWNNVKLRVELGYSCQIDIMFYSSY